MSSIENVSRYPFMRIFEQLLRYNYYYYSFTETPAVLKLIYHLTITANILFIARSFFYCVTIAQVTVFVISFH